MGNFMFSMYCFIKAILVVTDHTASTENFNLVGYNASMRSNVPAVKPKDFTRFQVRW